MESAILVPYPAATFPFFCHPYHAPVHLMSSFPPGLAIIAAIESYLLWQIACRRFKFPAYLVQAAQSDGMPALGLTDHRLLSEAFEFVTACRKAKVQPLLGLEIDLKSGPLAFLAMSLADWSSLCIPTPQHTS